MKYLSEMNSSLAEYQAIVSPHLRDLETAHVPQPYDEVAKSPTQGRAPYRLVKEVTGPLDDQRQKDFHRVAKDLGSDRRDLSVTPRFIKESEFQTLIKGTEQRARAYQALLNDIANTKGRPDFVYEGHMSYWVLEGILAKYNETLDSVRELNLKSLAPLYAPDIVRGPDGLFYVLEDNSENPGGRGDATQARFDLLKLLPEYENFLSADAGLPFAAKLSQFARKMDPDGKALLLQSNYYGDTNKYFVQQLNNSGGMVISDSGVSVSSSRFKTSPDGSVTLDGQRVTLANLDVPFTSFKFFFPALYEAYSKNKVIVNAGPTFLSDKELSAYVEDMIRFYLKEEPILKTIETRSFKITDSKNNAVLDKDFFDEVFANISNYVIKDPKGLQGRDVWLGPHLKGSEVESLKEKVLRDPGNFIAQKYLPISQIDDQIVDFRVFAMFTMDDVVVGDHIWARSDSIYGTGKLNIHQEAGVTAVFRIGVDTPGLIGLINLDALERAKSAGEFVNALQPRKAKISAREKSLIAWLARRYLNDFLATSPNRTQAVEYLKYVSDPRSLNLLSLYVLNKCGQISDVQNFLGVLRAKKLNGEPFKTQNEIERNAAQKVVTFMEAAPKWQKEWGNMIPGYKDQEAKLILTTGYLKSAKTPEALAKEEVVPHPPATGWEDLSAEAESFNPPVEPKKKKGLMAICRKRLRLGI